MKYLWKDVKHFATLIKKSAVKALLLDFDGTLTPIVPLPKNANLSEEVKKLLQDLTKKQNSFVVIISGRKLADVKEKVGISNIIYAGNHGLEQEINGTVHVQTLPKNAATLLKKIKNELLQITNSYKKTFIEDKGQIISFHYRMADDPQIPAVKALFYKVMQPYIKKGDFSVLEGKKVLEITPNMNWHKGRFANVLLETIRKQTKTEPLVVAIGDDMTDENMFLSAQNGITVVVGKNNQSKAKYYLNDTQDVARFLEWLHKTI